MKHGEKYKKLIIYVLLILSIVFLLNTAAQRSGDLESYLRAGTRMLDGQPVYVQELYPYMYPPLLAFLLIPFTFLSLTAAKLLWCGLNLFLLFLAGRLLLKMVDKKGINTVMLCFLTVLSTLRFFIVSSHRGQVNIVVLFLCVAVLYFFREGKDLFAGIALGAAVVIKISPILILLYFIYKRKFKLSAYAAVGGIGFMLLPSLVLGFHGNLDAVSQYGNVVQDIRDHDKLNQSLHNGLRHLLSPVSITDNTNINILHLEDVQIKYVTYALIGMAALFGAFFFRKRSDRYDEAFGLEYSLLIILMLLVAPVSRNDHFVTLFIPHFFYLHYLLKHNVSAHWKKRLLILVISFACSTLTVDGIVGDSMSNLFESYFCITIGTLVLLGGLVHMRRSASQLLPGGEEK